MKVKIHSYTYDYDSKELNVGCQIEIPESVQLEIVQKEVIKKFGIFDEKKLKFKSHEVVEGKFEQDKFVPIC